MESALERLSRLSSSSQRPALSESELFESAYSDDEDFLSTMSQESLEALNRKVMPQPVEEESTIEKVVFDEEEDEQVEEIQEEGTVVEEEKVAEVTPPQPKKRGRKKKQMEEKVVKQTTEDPQEIFLASIAREVLVELKKSNIQVHNFNKEQMEFIWTYIFNNISF